MAVEKDSEQTRNGGSRPVPDPTVLTTELIDRAIKAEREWAKGQLEIRDQRLEGIDEATKLLRTSADMLPDGIHAAVDQLKELHNERFDSIQTQFKERDTRSEREARDNKLSVDAAFAAQEKLGVAQNKSNAEARDKSEILFTDSIEKSSELFKTTTDAISNNLSDVKDRVGLLEQTSSQSISALEARLTLRIADVGKVADAQVSKKEGGTDQRQIIQWVLGTVLGLITIGSIIFGIVASTGRTP